MSTRSIICKKNSDGTYTGIYCHWDGYVGNNGRILNDNYTTEESIDRLLALGDLSSLGKTPEDPGDLWERERRTLRTVPLSRDDPEYVEYWNLMDEYCKSYRSRGETGIDARTYKNLRDVRKYGEAYTYVWDDKHGWRVTSYDYPKWTSVARILRRIDKEANAGRNAK